MNPDTLRLILQIVGVVVGGGILEFSRRMINRRAELRELDAKSNATALNSANAYIRTLQDGEKTVRADLAELHKRLDDKDAEIARVRDMLADERRETARVRTELGIVRSDLDIARSQIADLLRRLPGL